MAFATKARTHCKPPPTAPETQILAITLQEIVLFQSQVTQSPLSPFAENDPCVMISFQKGWYRGLTEQGGP